MASEGLFNKRGKKGYNFIGQNSKASSETLVQPLKAEHNSIFFKKDISFVYKHGAPKFPKIHYFQMSGNNFCPFSHLVIYLWNSSVTSSFLFCWGSSAQSTHTNTHRDRQWDRTEDAHMHVAQWKQTHITSTLERHSFCLCNASTESWRSVMYFKRDFRKTVIDTKVMWVLCCEEFNLICS